MNDEVGFREVNQWLRAAAVCGFDLAALLRAAGLDELLTHPETAVIQRSALRQLMRQCIDLGMKAQPPRYFPVALGRAGRFEYLSDLETVLATAATFREVLPVLDLIPLFYDPTIRITVSEFGSEARFEMTHIRSGETDEQAAPFIEQFFLATAFACHQWLEDPHVAARITFRHKAHAGSEELAAAFPVSLPIAYDKEFNACWFDREVLDRPLRNALPALNRAAFDRLEKKAREAIHHGLGVHSAGFEAKLEQMLMQRPELLAAKQCEVAEAVGLTVRVLQRRLKTENTTYADVARKVRLLWAQRLLETSALTVSDIGKRLGYASRSAFAEAFTRQLGVAPSAYRAAKNTGKLR